MVVQSVVDVSEVLLGAADALAYDGFGEVESGGYFVDRVAFELLCEEEALVVGEVGHQLVDGLAGFALGVVVDQEACGAEREGGVLVACEVAEDAAGLADNPGVLLAGCGVGAEGVERDVDAQTHFLLVVEGQLAAEGGTAVAEPEDGVLVAFDEVEVAFVALLPCSLYRCLWWRFYLYIYSLFRQM